jgi:hypothetical protein
VGVPLPLGGLALRDDLCGRALGVRRGGGAACGVALGVALGTTGRDRGRPGPVDDGLQVRVGEAGVDAGDRSEGRRAQVGVDPCGPHDGGVVALDDEAAGAGVRPRTHRGPLG